MLATGKQYTGKVIRVQNAFDNFPKRSTNERMWCHEVIMLVDGEEVRCQHVNMEPKQDIFHPEQTVTFEVKTYSQGIHTINRILEDNDSQEEESDVCGSIAQIALRNATLLHQYQPGSSPENVVASADVFFNWLQKKRTKQNLPF